MDRLGLGYSAVSGINPRLVYGSITGYGSEGPYRNFPGQDLLVQCISGLVWLNGRAAEPPTAVGMPIIDAVSGQQLAMGIVAALFKRELTGDGQRVEVSLLNTAIDLPGAGVYDLPQLPCRTPAKRGRHCSCAFSGFVRHLRNQGRVFGSCAHPNGKACRMSRT